MLAIIKHFIANAHQITTAFDAADFAFAYPLNWLHPSSGLNQRCPFGCVDAMKEGRTSCSCQCCYSDGGIIVVYGDC